MLHTDSALFHAIVGANQDPDPYQAMRYRPFAPTARLRAANVLAKAQTPSVQGIHAGGLLRRIHAVFALATSKVQALRLRQTTAGVACCAPACC